MEWLIPWWAQWLDLGDSPASWRRSHHEAVPASPTALDLWVIQLTYEVVAAESTCARCGARLCHRLRVMPSAAARPGSWTLPIVTRCKGFRRHRHIAIAEEVSDDLVLGPFHAGRRAGPSIYGRERRSWT
jgi:hypothetical protein